MNKHEKNEPAILYNVGESIWLKWIKYPDVSYADRFSHHVACIII